MRQALVPSREQLEALIGSPIERCEPVPLLDGGSHSRVFDLATTSGSFILRVPRGRQGFYTAYLPPSVPRDRWLDQRRALDAAKAVGVPAPRLVASHRGRPRFVILTKLPAVPIRDYDTWTACPYDEAQFGAILARLYAVTATGFGPIDDFGQTYYSTWPAFLQAVARHVLATCQARASVGAALLAGLRERWYPRLATVELARPALLHLESLGFANLLYDPASRAITGLLDYEDCIGGDPLFELTWMTYYLGPRTRPRAAFDFERFTQGYGAWPGDEDRESLYLALMYLEKLAWIDPEGARAAEHRDGLATITRAL
jgi:aminoglycoside phosphotransferase (APT) family kinase protein